MPNNLLTVDTAFPTFTEDQTNDEKLDVVTNYLYMLLEQLRYTLQNLGMGNFNGAELTELGLMISEPISVHLESLEGNLLDLSLTTSGLSAQIENVAGAVHDLEITADLLTSQIEDAEGNISAIEQYAKSITLSVTNGETSSTIKLLAGGVQIASQIIQMDGLVTFTGLEDGTTVINGGCIQTGTIDTQYLNLTGAITFNDLSNSVQDDIDDAITTANDAYDMAYDNQLPSYIKSTYIDATRIESPTIIAGEFYGNEFNVYPQSGNNGSFNLYGDTTASRGYNMFSIEYEFDVFGPQVQIESPAGAPVYWHCDTTFFGSVDFSSADVTGLDSGSGDTLEGTYCDILASRDITMETDNGDIVMSCNGGDVRIACNDGELRIYVDGTTWRLDRDGWYK